MNTFLPSFVELQFHVSWDLRKKKGASKTKMKKKATKGTRVFKRNYVLCVFGLRKKKDLKKNDERERREIKTVWLFVHQVVHIWKKTQIWRGKLVMKKGFFLRLFKTPFKDLIRELIEKLQRWIMRRVLEFNSSWTKIDKIVEFRLTQEFIWLKDDAVKVKVFK